MVKTEKGFTSVRRYDNWANYNADTERTETTISFVQQDQSIVVGGKRYSQNAECYVGSNTSGISTTGNWFLCGEATITNARDVNIMGIVQQTVASGACGIFVLGLRGYSESASKFNFSWICKTSGAVPLLRVVINGHTVMLYCKVYGGQYQYAHIRLLNQCNQYESKSYKASFFTLKDSTTIIPEADVPSGTDIADVPYITTTAANNKFLPILATTSLVKNNPNVGYVKFAEMDTKGQVGNKAIILAVSTTFVTESNWNDGLYMLNIRGNGTSATTCRAFCFVQYKVSVDKIKLYYAVSGSKIEFYREVRTAKEFTQLGFKILSVENFENGSLWDFKLIESSKTTSDATLDTPIGALTEIPNRGHVYFADNAEKVLQTNATSSAERRVLLGENHETTQQDKIYKSPDLTYNPNSKTLTVPKIKNPNGSWVHYANGVAGQSGFVKIATINVLSSYVDSPIILVLSQRNIKEPTELAICFNSANSTDPTLNNFNHFSGSVIFGYYIHKSATSTWDIYVKKGQGWDAITVLEHKNPYLDSTHYSITWQNELVTTLPEGYLSAVRALKSTDISGNAATATKATQDGNGIVIAGNYQRVYKSSFHVTADGWYKLAFRPNTTGVLDWKDKYILVNVLSRQGGACSASFKILYSSQGGWMSTLNNEFLCIPLTTTNYACISNVRLLSKNTSVSGNSYIELYVQLSKGGNGASTDVEISIESNISNMYLYNTATAGETDTSAYTVITRNAVTGTYGGSLAVGGLIAEKALSANNVKQTPSVGNYQRRVLLGGNIDSEEYAGVYKSAKLFYNPSTETLTVPKVRGNATTASFLQSLEGLCHKSNDSSLSLQRKTEYICGQQVLSDTEEAGKAFYGSSANPLVISVPLKDPGDAVAGGKVNVNLIRYYYAENYWQELFFCVNSPNIYTRWVGAGKARQWYRLIKEDNTIEYNAWVTKATNATNADVANKTKYPIVFKRNGASITNWFADTTFAIDIPEELLDYSAPTGIALKVPEIDVAKEAKKVANKLSLTVNGSTTEYDGSAGARVSIKANCTHIVKANSSVSLGILYPEQTGHPSAVTVPVSILPLEPYNSAARGLNDGDTLILHVPNSMSIPTANYVWCVKLDITKENATDNIIPLIHGQSAGTPAYWNTSTTIPAGFYQFVYSATLGGLVYMYRNTSTT